MIGLPASLALFALAVPTVAALFGRGAFKSSDVLETASSLSRLGAGARGLVRGAVRAAAR